MTRQRRATTKRENSAQEVVLSISKIVSSDMSHAEALTEMLRVVCTELSYVVGSFWTLNETGEALRCETTYASKACPNFSKITRTIKLKRGLGLPGRVWDEGSAVWITDVLEDPNFPRAKDARKDGLHTAFAFPIRVGGKFIGVFEFFNDEILEPDAGLLDSLAVIGTELGQFFDRYRIENQLAISEKRFEAFAEVVDEVFFVGAPQLTEFFYVSPAYEKVWGRPKAELIEDPLAWAKAIIPEHQERVANYVSLLAGDDMPAESEIEYAITRPDGTQAWLSARCFRIDQHDGSWHICGTVRDVTDRKHAEQRVSDFYSMVSHELRTPLTSIKGALLLLERGKAGELSDRGLDLTLLARKECDRLIRLINNFLDIKTLDAGKLQLYCEDVSPAQVVKQTLETLSTVATEKKIKVRLTIETTERIHADRDRIIQVITNLLSNALKFSPAGSEVVVRVEKVGKSVRFSVVDQGPGISPENQDKLFRVFEQIVLTDRPSNQGTGLGLAISKGIIEEHGGRIGVVSDEGKGATFWFELEAVN